MAWTYDPTRDELTVQYDNRGPESRVIELPAAAVALDHDGTPIWVTVRDVKRYCSSEDLNDVAREPAHGEHLLTVHEASSLLGLKAYMVREEILSGGMPIVRGSSVWLIRECVLGLYRHLLGFITEAQRQFREWRPSWIESPEAR